MICLNHANDRYAVLQFTVERTLSAPKEGGEFFDLDPDTGVLRRNTNQPLDYDQGYHVIMMSHCDVIVCNAEGWQEKDFFENK